MEVTPWASVKGVSSKAKSSDFASILEPLLEYIIVFIALSDNLEQPNLPLLLRPLRLYQQICSYEPVLSFEIWIYSTEFTLSVVEWAQDKLVEILGFSAYLLSALRLLYSVLCPPSSVFRPPSCVLSL